MAHDDHVIAFYGSGTFERDRLVSGRGRLELVRMQELLREALPPPPARVLDVGGGPGTHAAWLAVDGYAVTLVDVTPALVDQARQRAGRPPTFAAVVGDARALDEPEESADAVILLGPLYHLPEAADRRRALAEAQRVLRPGGVLAAAGISRFAVLLDLLRMRAVNAESLARLSAGPLADGRLLESRVFTTAYFHLPSELADEVAAAGFDHVRVYGVEGPGWVFFDTAGTREGTPGTPDDRELVQQAASVARLIEGEESLLGVSSHLLATGLKPTRA
jgi:ubiquinone/menaquinone biosynthesis C-methylase UbiE